MSIPTDRIDKRLYDDLNFRRLCDSVTAAILDRTIDETDLDDMRIVVRDRIARYVFINGALPTREEVQRLADARLRYYLQAQILDSHIVPGFQP